MTRRTLLLPAAVFVVLTAAVLFVWQRFKHEDQRALQQRAELVADQTAHRIADFVTSRLEVVEIVRSEMRSGLVPDEQTWVRRTATLQEQFAGFHAINWIDEAGVIRYVSPYEPNRRAMGKSVFEHPVAGDVIARARDARAPRMTLPLTLFQGGRAFTTYYPVLDDDGELKGYVNGVFLIDPLIASAVRGGAIEDYDVFLDDGRAPVYHSTTRMVEPIASADVSLLDRSWKLSVVPRSGLAVSLRDRPHDALLLGGLALAFALAFLVRTSQERGDAHRRRLIERAEFEERLQHGRKMQAVGLLAGGVAHDFNNLLTAVLLNVELLSGNRTRSAADRRSLEHIREAVERASQLTAQLLTFSRRQKSAPRLLDLSREIERMRPMLEPLVRDDVNLLLALSPSAGVVRVDPVQLGQVLMNLMVNAVDAMPDGGQLIVTTRREAKAHVDGPGAWTVLSVRDEGVGMDEETRTRIFEPFFTTKEAGKGTGLGLSTVYGIVTGAEGVVNVRSEPGRGTTFEIRFPTCDEIPAEVTEPDVTLTGELNGTALIVEDEEAVLDVADQLLQQSGLSVVRARDGRSALDAVEDGLRFDVLVTDAVMPHMGGVALIRTLRERLGDFAAVLCSGYDEQHDPQELTALGCAYVPKPYSKQQLIGAVEEQLVRSRELRRRQPGSGVLEA